MSNREDALDEYQTSYWEQRARSYSDGQKSIADVHQRDIEIQFVLENLRPPMTVLEVGCGSGEMTNRICQTVSAVYAVDRQPLMIDSVENQPNVSQDGNVTTVCADFLEIDLPRVDAIVCARVLINLPSIEHQRAALAKFGRVLKPNGILILLEGFTEAFYQINAAREVVDLSEIGPSDVNLYLSESFKKELMEAGFELLRPFENGLYDFLTRVVLPFSETAVDENSRRRGLAKLCVATTPDMLPAMSRVQGGVYKLTPP